MIPHHRPRHASAAVATAVLLCALGAAARATVIHVPADFPTIQQAIDAAASNDTILVAPGAYGAINLLGKKLIIEGTGGAAVTTLDAGGAGSVVTASSTEPLGTTLRGLTLTGGAGQMIDAQASGGGGVYANNGAHLELADCVIAGNVCVPPGPGTYGGGVLCHASSVTLRDCTISGNTAFKGGAASNRTHPGASLTLHGCTVTGNTTLEPLPSGSAIDMPDGGLTLSNTLIADNVGSGVWHTQYGISLDGCVFRGNTGWGFRSFGTFGTDVFGCQFLGNDLGGASLEQVGTASDQHATDCVFTNGDILQSTPGPGGKTRLERCTFDGAQVKSNFGVIAHHVIVRNVAAPVMGSGTFTATYSNVQGGAPGAGNIDADPLWVDAAAGDYHLQDGSPCIDAGDPAALLDPDLSPPDLGALRHAVWDDLGGGVGFGTGHGGPLLTGQGELAGGNVVGLQLTRAKPLESVTLILGASALGVTYKGGILWPALDVLLTDQMTDAAGALTLAALWPAALPPGFSFWTQAWFKSTGTPAGFAGTNGVRVTTP